MLTPEQRSLVARRAAYARWAKEDPAGQAEILRRGFLKRFADEVDPERVLPEDERARRIESAMRSHMAALSLRASKARAEKRGEVVGAGDAG